VRLRALADPPYAFGSRLEDEQRLDVEFWRGRVRESGAGETAATFAALDGGRPVAMAGGYVNAEPPGRATVWGVWVEPAARRLGLGRALVVRVIDWAAGTPARELRLCVTDTAPARAAAALYLELGFRETGEMEPLDSDPALRARTMALPLRPPPAARLR
jgi:ribosomal protein S18 acetylase RimI-like enzyme